MITLSGATSKGRIYTYFNAISREDVKKAMLDVIVELRNITEDKAKNVKRLRSNEVTAVRKALGDLD